MSRFFVKNDSDSSSEEEDLLSSEEEALVSSSEEEQSDSDFFQDESDDSDSDSDSDAPKGPTYFLKSSFKKGSAGSDSDSDEEDRRVVKSAKEKLTDDMKESIDKLDTAKMIHNWVNVLGEFDKLGRILIRAGQQNLGTPNSYIVALADLEEVINEVIASNDQEGKKKTPADQSRAFNTLRQRVKRQIKDYQVLYDLYKEDPSLFDKDEPVEIPLTNAGQKVEDDGTTLGGTRNLSPVFHTLKQISESRGKKNIDKYEQIQTLESLLEENKDSGKTFELISIYQMLISIRFDATAYQNFMPLDQWKTNLKDISGLLKLLNDNLSTYQVSELGRATDEVDIEPEANEDGVKVIFGSISSSIERLDDEFTRSLQSSDPHSTEYVERLKDESSIYRLILKGQLYIEAILPADEKELPSGTGQLSRIISRRLDHIYYKPNQLIKSTEEDGWSHMDAGADSSITPRSSNPAEVVASLVEILSRNSSDLYSKKAVLSNIYYFAVNNDYKTASELFLSSHIYSAIHSADSSLQVMYNRALVQLGLSAFRAGLIEESHQALNEIANTQRLKELLGQGFNSKYPSQATVSEKQKLLPFHMHINLELLECVFMTSSLLIEIPALAAASSSSKDSKRKAPVRSFKSKLEFHDRQYFTGPPESIKDHIIHASRALQKGNWHKAYELLSSIKIWKLFSDNTSLLAMLQNQLQIEGLRTYIFTYKGVYSKLSVEVLSANFKLDSDKVVSIVNKMIDLGDINATFDDSKKFLNFTSSEPQRTRLQELAIIMNEKVGLLTEKNERTASNGHSRKNPHQNRGQRGNRDQNRGQNRNQAKEQEKTEEAAGEHVEETEVTEDAVEQQEDSKPENEEPEHELEEEEETKEPSKDQPSHPQPQPQSHSHHRGGRDREAHDDISNKFRYANVNSNNDEFQAL